MDNFHISDRFRSTIPWHSVWHSLPATQVEIAGSEKIACAVCNKTLVDTAIKYLDKHVCSARVGCFCRSNCLRELVSHHEIVIDVPYLFP